MTGMADVLDPTDINIYRDLAGGLTSANILHGSANPIGGKNVVIKLRWGKTRAQDLVFEGAMPGIKFALGENPKDLRQGQITGPRRYPVTRMGVEYVIRDAFTRAKAYQKAWQDYDRKKGATVDALPPKRDLQLEPLVEILEGKRLVHAHSYRADEILMMIRLAEEMGFKIATFQHVLEGYKVAKEIAAHGAGASTFSDWWGYKIEAADAIPHNAAIMVRKGVLTSVNSDSAELARRLNTEAAKSIRWGGLTEEEAFALVTINPAKQLEIDNRVGSLEAGKDADVVVWSHHPLSTYAIAERVYIDGTLYYDRLSEDARLTAVKKEKADLAASGERHRPRTRGDGRPSRVDEAAAATVGRPAPSGVRPAATGTRGPGAGRRSRLGHRQREDPSDHERHDRARHDRHPRQQDRRRSAPTFRCRPARRPSMPRAATSIPGFINARTTLGFNEPGPRGYEDVNEMHDYNPQLRTRSRTIPKATRSRSRAPTGLRRSRSLPGGGIFGGEVAVMNLDGWTWEEATLKPNAGDRVQLPEHRRRWRTAADAAAAAVAAPPRSSRSGSSATTGWRRFRATFALARAYAKGGPDKPERLDARGARAGRRRPAAAADQRVRRQRHPRRRGVRRAREGEDHHRRRHGRCADRAVRSRKRTSPSSSAPC